MDINALMKYCNQYLVDLRRVPVGDHEVWEDLANNKLLKIHGAMAIEVHEWSKLKFWQQAAVRTVAGARQLRTGVVILRSAALLHGLPVLRYPERLDAAVIGMNRPSANQGMTHYRRLQVPPRAVVEVQGLRVTSMARTALDIARIYGFVEGLVAVDAALRNGAQRKDMEFELATMIKQKGRPVAERCLRFAIDNSESPYESVARAFLIDAGYENLKPQYRVGNYRADLCIDDRIIVEIDGASKYAEIDDFRKERDREKELLNAGYVVLRFAPAQLKSPRELLKAVEQAKHGLAQRAA